MSSPIHIIGIGAIGSTVAINLARLGVEKLYLYDFDTVSSHNIANQQFRYEDIGARKVDALTSILKEINPRISVNKTADAWSERKPLSGHVFMCVDSMNARRQIMQHCMMNLAVEAIYDFRMGLSDAQHYAAATNDSVAMTALFKSMQHTDAEAKANVPVSACNTELSVYPTVATITSLGVANFINYVKGTPLKKMILLDAFSFTLDAF